MMKTQSLSMSMTNIQVSAKGQSRKMDSASFEGYISREKSAGANQNVKDGKNVKPENGVGKTGECEENRDVKEYSKSVIKVKNDSQKEFEVTPESLDAMNSNIVSIMAQATGLDEEDIVDIMEQMGAMPVDFTLVVTEVEVTINVENIKDFVMETHGIDDVNLFLTSDRLMEEVNEILSGIENMLSDMLDVDFKSLLSEDISFLQNFQEMLVQYSEGEESGIEWKNEKDVIDDFENGKDIGFLPSEHDTKNVMSADLSEDSNSTDFSQSEENVVEFDVTSSREEDMTNINATQTSTFVERLNESIQEVTSGETSYSEVSMDQVVEQVVKHIRIRVLPQTTSMELQLNPETLGRVNLNVVSNNGVATATLTVQNEFAKEALESQLVVLRENLESQGLKVESVEVNVSEFGFKDQEDANQEQYKPKNGRRRLRADSIEDSEEEIPENEQLTDSVVDYTA